MNPIVFIHGYSAEGPTDPKDPKVSDKAIESLYGRLPDLLRTEFNRPRIVKIDLTRYISLEDSISIDDVALALDRALRDRTELVDKKGKLKRFSAIVHSTGALVIRNWIRSYASVPCEAEKVIYLAGANFGSGMAHIGKGELAKWARHLALGGTERGLAVLNSLELGSSWTIDLHRDVDHLKMTQDGFDLHEYCIVGSHWPEGGAWIPIRYVREDGADGVVRACSCNLNYNFVRIYPTKTAKDLSADETKNLIEKYRDNPMARLADDNLYDADIERANERPVTPFAIAFHCTHTGTDRGIVGGRRLDAEVLPLIVSVLRGNVDDASLQAAFEARTAKTRSRAAKLKAKRVKLIYIVNRRAMYDPHAQLVFRIRDQFGNAVRHPSVFINAFGLGKKPRESIGSLIEDRHENQVTPGIVTYYVRVGRLTKTGVRNSLRAWNGVILEISATEPGTPLISYVPCRYAIEADALAHFIQQDRTTIIDVELLRVGHKDVVQIAPRPDR